MKGEKVTLRAMESSDQTTIYEWENDPKTWAFGYRKWPISMEDVVALINQSALDVWQTKQMRLMIATTADRRTVGCVDIYDFDPMNQHCSLAIFVQEEDRRHGYATEALELMMRFATETLGVRTLLSSISADNAPSIALFGRIGFQEVGRLRQWQRRGDTFCDEVIMQRVRDARGGKCCN